MTRLPGWIGRSWRVPECVHLIAQVYGLADVCPELVMPVSVVAYCEDL